MTDQNTANYPLSVAPREFNTILAALRFWQRAGNTSDLPEYTIANDGAEETGQDDSLNDDEIDGLCERLNTADHAAQSAGVYAIAQEAIAAWPQFDPDSPRYEEEVNGGDLVEWFGGYLERLRGAMAKAAHNPVAPSPDALSALKDLRREIDAISEYWTEGLSNFAQQADAVIAAAESALTPDWRVIARDLAGALDACTGQIGQMRGMFDDGDGEIAQALEDAEKAAARYTKAVAPAPDAPAPATRTIWTCTTDGDECELTVTVHNTEAEAHERVREDLRKDCKPHQLASLNALPASELADAWEDTNDGYCAIESHEIAA